jgi:hypothetical protein
MRARTEIQKEEAARVGLAITIMLTKTVWFQKRKFAVPK